MPTNPRNQIPFPAHVNSFQPRRSLNCSKGGRRFFVNLFECHDDLFHSATCNVDSQYGTWSARHWGPLTARPLMGLCFRLCGLRLVPQNNRSLSIPPGAQSAPLSNRLYCVRGPPKLCGLSKGFLFPIWLLNFGYFWEREMVLPPLFYNQRNIGPPHPFLHIRMRRVRAHGPAERTEVFPT